MEVFQRFMGAGRFVHIIGQLSPRLASEGGHGYQFRQAKQLAEVFISSISLTAKIFVVCLTSPSLASYYVGAVQAPRFL
jgi:hypothetical protein